MATEVRAKEAAKRLGVGLNYLYLLIYSGKLRARRENGRWFVDEESIDQRNDRLRQSLQERITKMDARD